MNIGPRRSSMSVILAGAALGLAGMGMPWPSRTNTLGIYPARAPQKRGERRPKARDGAQGGARKSRRG